VQGALRESAGGMFVVSETSVRYLAPARLDDELLVTAKLEAAGRASLIIAQQALKGGTLLAEGTIRIGWVTDQALRPARLDDELLVTADLQACGRAGMVIAQQAMLLPHRTVLAEGTIRIGWVDSATLRPARIPASILDALNR